VWKTIAILFCFLTCFGFLIFFVIGDNKIKQSESNLCSSLSLRLWYSVCKGKVNWFDYNDNLPHHRKKISLFVHANHNENFEEEMTVCSDLSTSYNNGLVYSKNDHSLPQALPKALLWYYIQFLSRTVFIIPLPCLLGHLLCMHEVLIAQYWLIQKDEDHPCQQIQKHLESNKHGKNYTSTTPN